MKQLLWLFGVGGDIFGIDSGIVDNILIFGFDFGDGDVDNNDVSVTHGVFLHNGCTNLSGQHAFHSSLLSSSSFIIHSSHWLIIISSVLCCG